MYVGYNSSAESSGLMLMQLMRRPTSIQTRNVSFARRQRASLGRCAMVSACVSPRNCRLVTTLAAFALSPSS